MSTRITQAVRPVVVDAGTAAAGGNTRITQAARVSVIDDGTRGLGGAARVTQVVRVVICTVQPLAAGGGLMERGYGA